MSYFSPASPASFMWFLEAYFVEVSCFEFGHAVAEAHGDALLPRHDVLRFGHA